jgi:DNA-binding NarL/FixJ family response regulator
VATLRPRGLRVLVVGEPVAAKRWLARLELQRWIADCLIEDRPSHLGDTARRLRPDVALIDVRAGGRSTIALCRTVIDASPHTRVLLVAAPGRVSVEAARAAGATGLIDRDSAADDVFSALRLVGNRMTVFSPRGGGAAAGRLSDRELEVLKLMAAGATNREIAAQLHLSPHTIKEYASSIYRKLGARNRAEAVQRAAEFDRGWDH